MFAIITSKAGTEAILYGPFRSEDTAERYARFHRIWGACCIVKLHDSDIALTEDWR